MTRTARLLGPALLLLAAALPTALRSEPLLEGSVAFSPRRDGRSPLEVSGWAVSGCGAVDLTLVVDGREVLRGRPFAAWPGVRERFPGLAGAEYPGFSARVEPYSLAPGRHEAVVTARAGACGAEKELGRLVFDVASPLPGWAALLLLLLLLGVAPGALGLAVARRPERPVTLGWLPWAVPILWLAGVVPTVLAPRLFSPEMPVGPGPFDPLASWDSAFYLEIARAGYDLARPQGLAFFPLFPLLIRPLLALPVPAPLAVSVLNGLLLLALAALLRRVRKEADLAVLLYLLLPPASFFSVVYTEALFVTLAAAAVVFLAPGEARPARRRWGFAASFLAALCRVTGVALALLAADQLRARRWGRALAVAASPALGLGAFAAYLWLRTGDPVAFLSVQARFGRSASFDAASFLDVARSALARAEVATLWGAALLVAALAGAAGLCREGRWGEGLYSAAVVLMPLATVSLVSVNRYSLAAFPAFLFLGSRLPGRSLPIVLGLLLLAARVHSALIFGRQGFAG